MNWRRILTAISLVLVGALLVLATAAYWRVVLRWRHTVPIVRGYLEAARGGDSAALARASLSSDPVIRTLTMARTAPAITDSVIVSLRVKLGESVNSEESVIFYSTNAHLCGEASHPDGLQVRLARRDGRWMISYIAFGAC